MQTRSAELQIHLKVVAKGGPKHCHCWVSLCVLTSPVTDIISVIPYSDSSCHTASLVQAMPLPDSSQYVPPSCMTYQPEPQLWTICTSSSRVR